MLIAWEITRSCPLSCLHCRGSAKKERDSNELSFEEIKTVLEDIASFAKPILILTGGEPMNRADVYDIASLGTELGLRVVMAPCGLLVNRSQVEKMKKAGIARVSLSIDGKDAKSHDAFRGVDGAFDSIIKAAEHFSALGMPFQINTTVTKNNIDSIPQILALAKSLGAVAFHPFMLVPTGRGKQLQRLLVEAEQYEKVLKWIANQPTEDGFLFKPTCAPHYVRLLRSEGKIKRESSDNASPKRKGHPSSLDTITRGCMGGSGFAFISHVGTVQACGFLDISAGNLRENNLSLKKIWQESKLFKELRNPDLLTGKCGFCEFRKLCAGCRARAYEINGDYLGEEPYCTYLPQKTK